MCSVIVIDTNISFPNYRVSEFTRKNEGYGEAANPNISWMAQNNRFLSISLRISFKEEIFQFAINPTMFIFRCSSSIIICKGDML